MTKHRSRRDVDRMILRRWYGYRPSMFNVKFSTDPALADELWKDLRKRCRWVEQGVCQGRSIYCVVGLIGGGVHKITLNGYHYTWMDVIARLWLEVTPLERGKG